MGSSSANQDTNIPWSREEISSCNCDEKPFTFTESVGIGGVGQCTGVQNCSIGGTFVFLLGLQMN